MGICANVENKRREKNSNFKGENNPIISQEQLFHLIRQINNCLCKIILNDINIALGFLCKIPFPDKFNFLHVLITQSSIFRKNDIDKQGNIIISLNNDNLIYKINIDSSRKIYINELYGIIMIEIKKDDKININNFLEIDYNIFNNNLKKIYEKQKIIIFFNLNFIKYSIGIIRNIDEANYIYHTCPSEAGSSGGPIINLTNNKVIGIHPGIDYSNKNINKGILIKAIIDDFYKKNVNENNINFNNDNKDIVLYFIFKNGKELYLDVKESFYFKNVIKELFNKYLWLEYMDIIGYKYNGEIISRDKTVKENGLKDNSYIEIIEK